MTTRVHGITRSVSVRHWEGDGFNARPNRAIAKVGFGRILFWPDTGYPADLLYRISGIRPDIRSTPDIQPDTGYPA